MAEIQYDINWDAAKRVGRYKGRPGTFDLKLAHEINASENALMEAHRDVHPDSRTDWILDLTGGQNYTKEARAFFSVEPFKEGTLTGFCGTLLPFPIFLIANLVTWASGNRRQRFFSAEPAALAWVQRMRARENLALQGSPTPGATS